MQSWLTIAYQRISKQMQKAKAWLEWTQKLRARHETGAKGQGNQTGSQRSGIGDHAFFYSILINPQRLILTDAWIGPKSIRVCQSPGHLRFWLSKAS